MNADDRQREILTRARVNGRVAVTDLATELDVAPETVRRDLKQLAERGVLRRAHGGAFVVESAGFETDLTHRSTSLLEERRRIATAALTKLGGAESVYIDEGVTPQFVAEALPGVLDRSSRLTVVTSSLLAAHALANAPGVTVIVLGGRLRGATMATVDHWAIQMLEGLVIDLAYIGANGVSREHGLTTPDPAVAAVKRRVMASARRKVFVGLHTKFGVTTFCRFAEVADFEVLVTDKTLSASEAHRYSVLGPQVIRT